MICSLLAPSQNAASRNDESTALRAARKMMALKPAFCHSSDSTNSDGPQAGLAMKKIASPPRSWMIELTTPMRGLRKKYMMLTTTTVEMKCGA